MELYWFAAYADTATVLSLTPHPEHGATFADDSVPALLDVVAALGTLGFGLPGEAPCPGESGSGTQTGGPTGAIASLYSGTGGGTEVNLTTTPTAFLSWSDADSIPNTDSPISTAEIELYLHLIDAPEFSDVQFHITYRVLGDVDVVFGVDAPDSTEQTFFPSSSEESSFGTVVYGHTSGGARQSYGSHFARLRPRMVPLPLTSWNLSSAKTPCPGHSS